MTARKPFIAQKIDLVDHRTLIPADYNPREMDQRSLRLLVRSLVRFGWVLPVVVNRRTGNIVGGHQRARANQQIIQSDRTLARQYAKVPVIYVDVSLNEEKALNVALNQISGDWDFFKKAAADELRQNATFAQMARKHHQLSRGYRAPLGLDPFDFKDRAHFQQFVATYGTRILDFGCGRGQEVEWLSSLGIRAVGFEPFRRVAGSNKLDVAESRRQADGLLDALAAGFVPETVFCNFVISSIAQPGDRDHVLTILSALASRGKQCVIAVRSTFDVCYQQVLGRVKAAAGYLGVPDASEPGLIVTHAGTTKQMFQKYFDECEFVKLLKRFFGSVEIKALEPRDSALVAVCSRSKVTALPGRLERALRFEFGLPINGESIDRSARAVEVVGRFLKAGAK